MPSCDVQEQPRGATKSEVRGGGGQELPHVQGAVAPQAQEALEELFHPDLHIGFSRQILKYIVT